MEAFLSQSYVTPIHNIQIIRESIQTVNSTFQVLIFAYICQIVSWINAIFIGIYEAYLIPYGSHIIRDAKVVYKLGATERKLGK